MANSSEAGGSTSLFKGPPLFEIDPAAGKLRELVTLPSGGDTSYPGLVLRGDNLYVSYYSSHEGKTSIYFDIVKTEKVLGRRAAAATTAR